MTMVMSAATLSAAASAASQELAPVEKTLAERGRQLADCEAMVAYLEAGPERAAAQRRRDGLAEEVRVGTAERNRLQRALEGLQRLLAEARTREANLEDEAAQAAVSSAEVFMREAFAALADHYEDLLASVDALMAAGSTLTRANERYSRAESVLGRTRGGGKFQSQDVYRQLRSLDGAALAWFRKQAGQSTEGDE
jgi:chromosome segregation ATPase